MINAIDWSNTTADSIMMTIRGSLEVELGIGAAEVGILTEAGLLAGAGLESVTGLELLIGDAVKLSPGVVAMLKLFSIFLS